MVSFGVVRLGVVLDYGLVAASLQLAVTAVVDVKARRGLSHHAT
jgi:hypothetical protein